MYSFADSIRTWMVSVIDTIHSFVYYLLQFNLSACNWTVMLIMSFICQLEMKQRYLVSKMNVSDEKEGGQEEVSMDTLGDRY